MKQETKESIEWVMNNFEKLSNELENYYLDNSYNDTKEVIWILDREDGTADSYETSRERIGIKEKGIIVWGFTSGCSCWSGWEKDEYSEATYKEFIIKDITQYDPKGNYWRIREENDLSFSEGWEEAIIENVNELKERYK